MPLYEYSCDKCGKVFEVMQKFSDEPLQIHEECGGRLSRLISPPALHFKGSGFYITDYAKGTAGADSSGKADSKASESSTSEGAKSESSKTGSSSKSDSGSSTPATPTPATTGSSKSNDS